MQLSRDGPRQILSAETWPTKGQDTLKLSESLFMFRRQILHTYTIVVWGFYIHCEKQAHIVHIEEPLLYASVMRLMWSHDTGWCQVRCSGCWLHGAGVHHSASSEVTRKPVPDIILESWPQCQGQAWTWISTSDALIPRYISIFISFEMQNYLLVLTLTLKSFYVHIRDYLSTSSFAIFASLAGDVLCRILGVVG